MMLTDQEIDALWPEITLPQKVARREILRKGIEANNAKVLADLKPDLYFYESVMTGASYRVHPTTKPDNWLRETYFQASAVSALIQRNEALELALSDSARTLSDLPSTNKQGTKTRQLFDRIQSLLKATP